MGYGTSHYLAPDYELGYPEDFCSPTPNRDLVDLINSLHSRDIRVLLDVVLGFMKEEPYRYIAFDDFYLEDPRKHAGDPDAESSRFEDGKKVPRDPFGASCPRYVRTVTTYDPIDGAVNEHLARPPAHADVPHALDAGLHDRRHSHGQRRERRQLGFRREVQEQRARAVRSTGTQGKLPPTSTSLWAKS